MKKTEHDLKYTPEEAEAAAFRAAKLFHEIGANPKLRKVNPLCFLSAKFTRKYVKSIIDNHNEKMDKNL